MSASLRSKSDKKLLLPTFYLSASDATWRILRRIFVLWCNRNVFEVLACFMLLSLTCLSLFHLKGVPRWSRADTTGLKYFWRSILTFLRLRLYILQYNMIRYNTIWYDIFPIGYHMIQYDIIWYDMIWYDMIWYDMIWSMC